MKKSIIIIVVLALIEIGLSLFLAAWRENFYNYIEHKNLYGFLTQIGVFTSLALVYCLVAGASGYFQKLASIEWSKRIVAKILPNLPSLRKIYNYRQKIENDSSKVPDLTLTIGIGIAKAVGYIVVFTIFLLYSYSYIYVLAIYLYALVAHFITKRIGTPLIPLNYEQQDANSTFRQHLTWENFENCIRVAIGLAKKTKKLTYMQSFVQQVAVVIPLLLISYEYFTTDMTLGKLMMFNGLCGVLKENLMYPLTQFTVINDIIASKKRLKEVLL